MKVRPSARRQRFRLFAGSMVLLIVALAFNTLFNLNTLENRQADLTLSYYQIAAYGLRLKLQARLQHVHADPTRVEWSRLLSDNPRRLLAELLPPGSVRKTIQNPAFNAAMAIAIVGPYGRQLYNTNLFLQTLELPHPVLAHNHNRSAEYSFVRTRNRIVIKQPLHSAAFTKPVSLVLILPAAIDFDDTHQFRRHMLLWLGGIFAVTSVLILLLVRFAVAFDHHGRKQLSRRFVVLLGIAIGASQFTSSAAGMHWFADQYLQTAKMKGAMINRMLRADFNSRLQNGGELTRATTNTALLRGIFDRAPMLESIAIYNKDLTLLHLATSEGLKTVAAEADGRKLAALATLMESEPAYSVVNIIVSDRGIQGFVTTSMAAGQLHAYLKETALNTLTGVVVAILFGMEMVLFFSLWVKRKTLANDTPTPIHYGLMRPAAFLFLFGIDIAMSFLPLHMAALPQPAFGLSKELMMSLPISVEFMCVGLAIMVCGVWVDRYGWHRPFLGGLVLALAGVLYSWLSPDALHFIVSRAVVGFGYGLVLMASQGFVIHFSDASSKATGLAHLFAGIYAGSLCGGTTGALLAERIGFGAVFLVGAAMIATVIVYTLLFMKKAFLPPEVKAPAAVATNGRAERPLVEFLKNKHIWALMLFSSLPAAIAVVGFLNYFSPIYLNGLAVSQASIGRVQMIYGLGLIYVGPYISRYVDGSTNKRTFIFSGCLLGSAAFLVFVGFNGLLATALAILLLGLSNSLVLSSQSAYALQLDVTRKLGPAKAIGIFRATSRIGQVLGPIIFGWVVASDDIRQAVAWIGIGYLVTALLFFILTASRRKPTKQGELGYVKAPAMGQ